MGVGVALCAAIGASALAQSKVADAPAALRRLIDCRKLTEEHARVVCYDAGVDAVVASLTSGDIVAVDKEQVTKVKRQAFGFSLPSLSLFDRADKPAPLENLSATVAHAYQRGDGAWVLELEDGAVWAQTDQEQLTRYPKKGSKAEIRKAAMGTFFINLDGQRAIRAKRVQ
ncbi:MAG: hypothetical protein JWQ29_1092 [Phenylobacterium sp.]|nr:hypothetical protein [Phenylobacterium sp.]